MKNYLYTITTRLTKGQGLFWVVFNEQNLEKRLNYCKQNNLTFKVETIRYETN
jgi:hypothetical protein